MLQKTNKQTNKQKEKMMKVLFHAQCSMTHYQLVSPVCVSIWYDLSFLFV